MRRHLVVAIALSAFALASTTVAKAEGWLFKPSTFSHDPATGARVNQYAPNRPAYVRSDETYFESGYRHVQFNLQAGGSADRLHVVQTWGAGEAIRPYGEWQFPFRAGATPYGPWGNPQGPWTMPFDSWVNPYGQWNRFPYAPWGPGYGQPQGPAYRSPWGPGYSQSQTPGYGVPQGGAGYPPQPPGAEDP
jgi:hypothetical protein